MVRLKDLSKTAKIYVKKLFQFLMVRLKASLSPVLQCSLVSFQFLMVRLKGQRGF